jgi:transcriptional regulator with XRE-family HTH domain
LAYRLREVAEIRGTPLYIVAELAGFSRPAFWAILNQQSSPTLNTVQRLAEALQVPPIELLQGRAAPPRARKPPKPRKKARKKARKKTVKQTRRA